MSTFAATQTQTVTIEGSCFGTGNTYSGTDSAYFAITDNTYPSEESPAGVPWWQACSSTASPYGPNSVTCDVTAWTDTSITFSGYTSGYGSNNWVVNPGDALVISVWNAQTDAGPANCALTAGAPGPTACGNSSPPPPPTTATLTTPSTTMMAAGASVTDSADVIGNSGAGAPTGTVDFYVCGPYTSAQLCASTADPVGAVTLATTDLAFSTATSGGFTPSAAGVYCFGAIFNPASGSTYLGSSDNVSGAVDTNECVVVSATSSGTLSPQEADGAVLGAATNLNECKKGVTQKDLVDCATGDFYEAFTDDSIPGRGVPLDLSRTYNSVSASVAGPLATAGRALIACRWPSVRAPATLLSPRKTAPPSCSAPTGTGVSPHPRTTTPRWWPTRTAPTPIPGASPRSSTSRPPASSSLSPTRTGT